MGKTGERRETAPRKVGSSSSDSMPFELSATETFSITKVRMSSMSTKPPMVSKTVRRETRRREWGQGKRVAEGSDEVRAEASLIDCKKNIKYQRGQKKSIRGEGQGAGKREGFTKTSEMAQSKERLKEYFAQSLR